jgi:transglutaminase-like putative cysteine protease
MERRDFLRLAAATPLAVATPLALGKNRAAAPGWRTFELTYKVDLSARQGAGRVWLPVPQDLGDYQRVLSLSWSGQADDAALYWERRYRAPIFSVAWGEADKPRRLAVTAHVATRDRGTRATGVRRDDREAAAFYLQPTEHMPVDGIVADTARRIVKGIDDPDARAKAIYEWVVDNTFRDPKTRGCGLGNIKFMLETGDLGGKCADINALFVGLARAAGIPAREVYGVRVAASQQFHCLGSSGNVAKAQHCRAEYFSPHHGWVPVDPADVRKAVLQEKLPLTDPSIVALREHLFGNWEMNWVGFNSARDFVLDPPGRQAVPYLMYPWAEFGDVVLDGREPAHFDFQLISRELSV